MLDLSRVSDGDGKFTGGVTMCVDGSGIGGAGGSGIGGRWE